MKPNYHTKSMTRNSLLTLLAATLFITVGCSDVVQNEIEPSAQQEESEAVPEADEVFRVVDEMPTIVGGIQAIVDEIKYPEEAKADGIEGRVLVQFIVDETGNVVSPTVIKGVDPNLDAEALRVVGDTKFVPGKHNGVARKVRLTLPVTFKLQ